MFRHFLKLSVNAYLNFKFLFQAALGGAIRVQGVYEDLNVQIPSSTPSHTK